MGQGLFSLQKQLMVFSRLNLKKKINKAKYFSIKLDNSTDTNRMVQCVLLVCYSIKDNAKTKFLSVDNVSHPTADQMASLILKTLKEELGWEPPSLENILQRADTLVDTQLESRWQ